MIKHMKSGPGQAKGGSRPQAQYDITHLADTRIGDNALEMILLCSEHRADDNCEQADNSVSESHSLNIAEQLLNDNQAVYAGCFDDDSAEQEVDHGWCQVKLRSGRSDRRSSIISCSWRWPTNSNPRSDNVHTPPAESLG